MLTETKENVSQKGCITVVSQNQVDNSSSNSSKYLSGSFKISQRTVSPAATLCVML